MGAPDINSAATVRSQYATTANLTTRAHVWRGDAQGRVPQHVALAAVVGERPGRCLDVGCGTGAFAARVAESLPGCEVLVVDQSEAMVAAARERGLAAQVADIAALPFEDDAFDVVSALWMLYHVPDVDAALREVRRVLRPGGLLLVATNSDEHLADLKREAGLPFDPLPFSAENGPAQLRRHFDHVEVELLRTRAVFDGWDGVAAYLASMERSADGLARFSGERTYDGATAVMRCR